MKKKSDGTSSLRINKIFANAEAMLVSNGTKSWYDKLSDTDKVVVSELKKEFMTGNYPNLTASSLAKSISEELGIKLSGAVLRSWLRKSN